MSTITELKQVHGNDLDHLLEMFGDIEIPILTTRQRQGDVMVRPMREGKTEGLVEVPLEGHPVIRGEMGGNSHTLYADLINGSGPIFYAPSTNSGDILALGVLSVPKGSVALLHHPEHGDNEIGEGTYRLTGKRTQLKEIQRVQD